METYIERNHCYHGISKVSKQAFEEMCLSFRHVLSSNTVIGHAIRTSSNEVVSHFRKSVFSKEGNINTNIA